MSVKRVKFLAYNQDESTLKIRHLLKTQSIISACENGQLSVIKMYARTPCIWNLEYSHGICIRSASKFGHSDIVEYLINSPKFIVRPEAAENEALFLACKNGYSKTVAVLLKDANVSRHGMTGRCFLVVAETGNVKIMRLLLQNNEIDQLYGVEILRLVRIASERGNDDIVSLLWGHRTFPSYSLDGCEDSVKILIITNWQWNHRNFKWYRVALQERIVQLLLTLNRIHKQIKIPKDIRLFLVSVLIKIESGRDITLTENNGNFITNNKISPNF